MIRTLACLFALLTIIAPAATAQAIQARTEYKRGIERVKNGDLDGAIADFSYAIEINSRQTWRDPNKTNDVVILEPMNAHIYYNRALAWLGKSDVEHARADF